MRQMRDQTWAFPPLGKKSTWPMGCGKDRAPSNKSPLFVWMTSTKAASDVSKRDSVSVSENSG